MSIIKLPIRYEGSEGEKILYTLFDNDISYSCIHFDKIKGLSESHKLRRTKTIKNANTNQSFEIEYVVLLDFYINDILLSDEFMVVQNLSEEVIIGDLTMRKWRIKLDSDKNEVIVDPKVRKFILKDLKREQNFKGTDWKKANEWAKSLDIQESAEELIAQLTK